MVSVDEYINLAEVKFHANVNVLVCTVGTSKNRHIGTDHFVRGFPLSEVFPLCRLVHRKVSCLQSSLYSELLAFYFSLAAFLTSDSIDLQELAANSDHLITTLVGYLGNRPDESDELVEEKHLMAFDRLREASIVGSPSN